MEDFYDELDGIELISFDEEEIVRMKKLRDSKWPECCEHCGIKLNKGETCKSLCPEKFTS